MEKVRDISMLDPPYPGLYGENTIGGDETSDRDMATIHLRAAQACTSCRKQKRRCDKVLPHCALCQKMGRQCDYSDSTPAPNADDFAMLRKKVIDLEARLEARQMSTFNGISSLGSRGSDLSSSESPREDQSTGFPTLFFLDGEIFHEGRLSVQKPNLTVPRDVTATLGSMIDIGDVAERYFENVHLWLPIVSKKRMQLTLSAPRFELSADLALLLLCMKLITQSSHGSPEAAQTALYNLVKRHATAVEASALMSLQLLQSCLLIAAYEIGNAIYPAAYLTTGHCVRIGLLLGINDRQSVPQVLRRSGAWAEVEEIKRVWWACMLLDR